MNGRGTALTPIEQIQEEHNTQLNVQVVCLPSKSDNASCDWKSFARKISLFSLRSNYSKATMSLFNMLRLLSVTEREISSRRKRKKVYRSELRDMNMNKEKYESRFFHR